MLTKAGAQLLGFRPGPPGAFFADVPAASSRNSRSALRLDDVRDVWVDVAGRHAVLHGARADAGRGHRSPRRHLRVRRDSSTRWRPARKPSPGATPRRRQRRAASRPTAAPVPAATGTPAGLGAVLRRCLKKDPAERWPDAVAMSDALKEVATPSRGVARLAAVPQPAVARQRCRWYAGMAWRWWPIWGARTEPASSRTQPLVVGRQQTHGRRRERMPGDQSSFRRTAPDRLHSWPECHAFGTAVRATQPTVVACRQTRAGAASASVVARRKRAADISRSRASSMAR